MKVKIGKYPSRWISNVYTRYMEKKYGYCYDGDNATRLEHALEALEDMLQTVYNYTGNLVLDRLKQRVSVHIDSWDTWSMDHTLAPIILPMLIQLKATQHGACMVDMKDVPKELRATKKQIEESNKTGEVDDNHFKRWDWVIDEMIFAFQSKVDDDWEDQFQSGVHDITWEPFEKGMSKMVTGPNDTFKIDLVGRKAYQEHISNGFRLFGKYFESLWD